MRSSGGRAAALAVALIVVLMVSAGGACRSTSKATSAFSRSGDDVLRASSRLLDDVPSTRMRSHLDDVALPPGATPSPVLGSDGVALTSGVQTVSAAAVADSAVFRRLGNLVETYGEAAYGASCQVIDALVALYQEGWQLTLANVTRYLAETAQGLPPLDELYTLVMGTGDEADAAAQILLWAACLGTA
jgi:hypothetical protein